MVDTVDGEPKVETAIEEASLPPAVSDSKEPPPTSALRFFSEDELLRFSRSGLVSLAHDRGYTQIGTGGRRTLVQRFLAIQASDSRMTAPAA